MRSEFTTFRIAIAASAVLWAVLILIAARSCT
jgi:hypothetical protein